MHHTLPLVLSAVAVSAMALSTGCARRQLNKMNEGEEAMFNKYQKSSYEEDMVTAEESREYEDQGQGVSPKVLKSIQDTVENVYDRDFGRCLQQDSRRAV